MEKNACSKQFRGRVVYLGVGRQDGVDRPVWLRSTDAVESVVEGHLPGSARGRRWARCRSVAGQGSLARPDVLHQFLIQIKAGINFR